jgi:2-dehydro-3-deoxyphosphogluconate aldolase / (4S)-4-hydroxy-2-oxoglutarate aldolase
MNPTLEQIGLTGIVPVVAIDDASNAVPLAQALLEGGIPCIEITFRTAAAQAAIAAIASSVPNMLIGAGTVLTVDQAKAAIHSGAKYIVSPGLSRNVVAFCQEKQIPITPGVATPTEIEAAMDLGLEIVKFFPAEAMGGIKYLSAISAPYKKIKFIPTGGIDENLLLSYLRMPCVHAIGGSWMVKADLISNKKFDEIRLLSKRAVSAMLGLQLVHTGINCSSAGEADTASAALGDLSGLPVRPTSSSIFVNNQVEFTFSPTRGKAGHFAIGTHFINRAVWHLERRGVKTLPETRSEKQGKLHAVYLEKQIGDFAVHLIQL